MLPFKNRLIKKGDFEKIHKNGRFYAEGNVMIKLMENGLGETRVGFIAGIKFSKKAVERNRIKRQLREVFREKIGEIKPGFDVVVMARKREKEKIKFEELRNSVGRLLEKGGLLKQASSKKTNGIFI